MKLLVERQLTNIIMIILTMTKSIICTHIHTPTISTPPPCLYKVSRTFGLLPTAFLFERNELSNFINIDMVSLKFFLDCFFHFQ